MSKVSGLLKGGEGENEEDPFQPRGVNYCPSFPKSVTFPSLPNGKKGFENLWSKRPKALKRGGKGGRFSLSPCQREGGRISISLTVALGRRRRRRFAVRGKKGGGGIGGQAIAVACTRECLVSRGGFPPPSFLLLLLFPPHCRPTNAPSFLPSRGQLNMPLPNRSAEWVFLLFPLPFFGRLR